MKRIINKKNTMGIVFNTMVGKMLFLMGLLSLMFIMGCAETEQRDNNNEEIAARNVRVVEAQRKGIVTGIRSSGRVTSDVNINLSPTLGGEIKKIHVTEGEVVSKNQLLVELDDFQLIQAEQSYKTAEKNYHRLSELLKTDSIDKQSFEEMETAYIVAKANYEQAVKNTRIKAPVDGKISSIALKEGESYNPMALPFLIRLLSFADMKAKMNLTDTNYHLAEEGMAAEIRVSAYPEKVFRGRVTYISPEADMSGAFACHIELTDSNNYLRHNQYARIFIITDKAEDTLVIPQEALLNDNTLFVSEKGRARRREISTGLYTPQEIEIISGLAEGEEVIVEGNIGLTDNYPVNILH